jgi:general secretion pathway protein A
MFLEHYGLREQPFGVTPDPRYLYFSAMHREALASLFYGIETGCGFVALIAPPGMGKTTLLIQLLERLRKSARTVFLFQTQCDSREFFRYLLTDLGVDASNQNVAHMHEALNSVLLSNAQMGRRFVLVIDEAQNLKRQVLETVRLLSDFETTSSKLMQIVLCGQPQLADRLSHPHMTQLRQRVSIISRLQPFDKAEVIEYVHHRLKVAGYDGRTLFDSDALDQIAAHCEGIPRNINNICFNALTLGYAKRLQQIDGYTVREVMSDLDMELLRSPSGSAPSLTQSCSPSLDSLEPPDELNYRAPNSAGPRDWSKIAKSITADERGEGHPIPLGTGNDSKATERILQLGRATPSESMAPPEIAVTYPGPDVTTNARAAAMPDSRNIEFEKARNGGSGRPSSSPALRPEVDVFPFKYKTQTREWLSEPPTTSSSFKATRPDPPVTSIIDRGYRTFSSEKFCGVPISNFRQTIQAQTLFEDGDASEGELEEKTFKSALPEPDFPNNTRR